jgi:hypothetical protein
LFTFATEEFQGLAMLELSVIFFIGAVLAGLMFDVLAYTLKFVGVIMPRPRLPRLRRRRLAAVDWEAWNSRASPYAKGARIAETGHVVGTPTALEAVTQASAPVAIP